MRNTKFFLNQAAKSLRLKPGFVAGVVTTLAMTLATLLAILTLCYYVVWQPLPYPDQEQVFKLDYQRLDQHNQLKATKFIHPAAVALYAAQQDEKTISDLVLSRYSQEVLSSLASQPKVNTMYVSPEWFSTLGAQAAVGRLFNDNEGINSFVSGAVISTETWHQLFQGDNNVLSQSITINGKSHPVVGVLDSSFSEPEFYQIGRKNQVWLPWDFNNSEYQGYWGLADGDVVMLAKSEKNMTEYLACTKLFLVVKNDCLFNTKEFEIV